MKIETCIDSLVSYAMNTGLLTGFGNVQSQMAQCLTTVGTCAA